MSPEFKKLAERRAEECSIKAEQFKIEMALFKGGYKAGALDPVLEEARRAMYRAEAFEEASEYTDTTYGKATCCTRFTELAQTEREKLAKIFNKK